MDTIFAQSSAPGKAGVSVFRISGNNALKALGTMADISNIEPRAFYLRELFSSDERSEDPSISEGLARPSDQIQEKREVLDQAMIVYFRKPASFTGEDVVEIHTHGSIAIAKLLTETLLKTNLVRIAEPGEFARRSFLNGKMDLTAAEGIADLIEAETTMQHRQAIRQMSGELERLYSRWKQILLRIISQMEAYIDFPDEEIPQAILVSTQNIIGDLKMELLSHLDDKRRGERLRNGLELVILGAPNVGKSSLLNFLAQREVAIVSNIAGTTRDVIETHLDIGGYPIIIKDTAGLRKDASDEIEMEGIKRAMQSAKHADIKVIMFDVKDTNPDPELLSLIDENTVVLVNKVDNDTLFSSGLIQKSQETHKILESSPRKTNEYLPISIRNNLNLGKLLNAIEVIAASIARPSEAPHITRARHRSGIERALSALNQCNINDDLVLATEDIRMTIRYLSILTGKIEVEEILGEIFSNFCIGK